MQKYVVKGEVRSSAPLYQQAFGMSATCKSTITSHRSGNPCFEKLNIPTQGNAVLRDPQYNKGSVFPEDERKEFELVGRLPTAVSTLEEQLKRAYQQYSSRNGALAKNTFMTSLKEQNWVLYYRVRLPSLCPLSMTPRSMMLT